MKIRLDHINIKAPMPALRQEKQFFCELLGLQEGFRPQFSTPGYWLYADDKPLIHLSESGDDVMHQGCVDHVAFQASGLAAFIDCLRDRQTPYTMNHIAETRTTQVFVRSPLGVRLEVLFIGERIQPD